MASKRAGSKDTIESIIGDVVEQVSMSLPIYEDTRLFIEKDIKITWKDINNTFGSNIEEKLEDRQVYVKIHKLGLYKLACRYPVFPCADMIHWIVSHTDSEMMILRSVRGVELATFKTKNY